MKNPDCTICKQLLKLFVFIIDHPKPRKNQTEHYKEGVPMPSMNISVKIAMKLLKRCDPSRKQITIRCARAERVTVKE
jgi:hypothetical protein